MITKSPSISSSTPSSFDTNMCLSRNANRGGCLAAFLRRILCSRILPKHQSNSDDKDRDSQPSVSPCIVARLMGLDSIPDLITSHSKTLKMNCVKKSILSMPMVPEFVEIENNDFIEFSFEFRRKSHEKRKSEAGFGESKKYRKRGKRRNRVSKAQVTKLDLENEEIYSPRRRVTDENCQKLDDCNVEFLLPVKMDSSLSKDLNCREVRNSAKLKKKKKIALNHLLNDTEHDQCSSEESSPVSVLDFGQFIIDPQNTNSVAEEVGPRSAQVNSKRKLSPELENYGNPSSSNLMSSAQKAKEQCYNKNYMEIWCKANRLTMAEIESSNWNSNLDDISSHFGSQILDTLLGEIVIEQISTSMQILRL